MNEWKEETLEAVVDKFIDYRGKTPTKVESGIPLVTAKIVKGGRILEPNEFISPDDYDGWMTRGLPEVNDVVLTTEAPLGEVGLIKDRNIALAQRIITLRGKPDKLFNPFLKYYLQSDVGQYELESRASGTTVFGIKGSVLRTVPIHLPELSEQKAIASVLSSLDDKIDLLHRQNQTLEAIAETLFRQWFIEGAGEDWEVVKVGDFVKTNIKSRGKNYPYKFVRYLDTGSLTEGKISEIKDLKTDESPSRAKRITKHNDILISTVRPNQKHYGIMKNPEENLVVSTGFCVISCQNIDPHFIYLLLTNDEMTEYLHSIAEGSTSTYPSLKPSDIEAVEFRSPPEDLLNKFSEFSNDFWEKLNANYIQIRNLEKLRYILLPKLMNGEVRVI